MKGVLVLAHGSRVDSTVNTMTQVVDMVRKEITDMPIEIAYMEFRDVNIEKGIEKLVGLGVDEILAVPYFIFEGIHIREDIPNEIEKALKKYPDVKVTMGNTLGVDKRLADILADRIREMI